MEAKLRTTRTALAKSIFMVEPCSTCYVARYLIVTPRNVVESLSRMNSAAVAALGPTLAVTTAAIEAVVRPRQVYCALFSEETRAVHFHLFPRTEWLTAKYFAAHPRETDLSGPRLMDWSRRSFQKPIPGMERDEILEKILVRLRSENFC